MRLDRRGFVGCALAASAVGARAADRGEGVGLYAGTYAAEGGAGLVPISYDAATDQWRTGTPVAQIVDASFGVHSDRFRRTYLLAEQKEGRIAGFDPAWRRTAIAPTGGDSPCHVALDARQSCLAVANYGSGSVALLRLDPAGGDPLPVAVVPHAGSGPVKSRQDGPHAHWVGFSPDDRWLHSIDLGTDSLFVYAYDPRAGGIGPARIAYRAPAGAGPRHLVRHPHLPLAYLVAELANDVTMLDCLPDGRFRARGASSTLPADFAGRSQAAEVAINAAGDRLYVSNRGHDSIAVFAVGKDGALAGPRHISSGGSWPRHFILLERARRLLVANERSGSVAIFRIGADGQLADTRQRLAIPGVVFLGRSGVA